MINCIGIMTNNNGSFIAVAKTIIGGVIFGLILLIFFGPFLFIVFSIIEGDTRRVNDTYVSPSGIYQVESINNSGGAMDQGESFLCLELIEDGEDYPVEGDKPSKKAVEIDDIHGRYAAEYEVEWISDDSFTVTWNDYDNEYIADVVIDGRSCTVTNTQTIAK